MRLRILPLFCLLVSAAAALPAQQSVSGDVCVVFTMKDLSAARSTGDYEATITQAVAAAFSSVGYTLVTDAAWKEAAAARSVDPGSPLSEADALQIAGSVGADIAVTGIYSVQNDEIYYSIQCWGVASGRLTAALQADTPFNLAFFSGLNIALSQDLLPRVIAAAQGRGNIVFVSPDEGMIVKLSGDQYVGRVVNGRLTLPGDSVVPGSRVVVQKSKPGFHPAEQTVTLTPGKSIPLRPLTREQNSAFELETTVGQLLGLGGAVRAYPVPGWFFFSLGSYAWAQPPATFALRAVLHVDTYANLGAYIFFNPDAPLRVGVAGGTGMILSFLAVPGTPAFSDFYVDVFSWWVETRLLGVTLFVRQDYKYALGSGANLLGQGWMVRNFPPTSLGVVIPW